MVVSPFSLEIKHKSVSWCAPPLVGGCARRRRLRCTVVAETPRAFEGVSIMCDKPAQLADIFWRRVACLNHYLRVRAWPALSAR